jgi:hypothetical protein
MGSLHDTVSTRVFQGPRGLESGAPELEIVVNVIVGLDYVIAIRRGMS